MDELQTSISYLLVQVMRSHRSCADSLLSKLGLHVGQEMILFRLWREDGITQTSIAECLCVEPPTVTKMLQRMEAAGFVERRQDAADARVSRVYLTERGRALQGPVADAWKELEASTVAGLTDREISGLQQLLQQLRENLAKD